MAYNRRWYLVVILAAVVLNLMSVPTLASRSAAFTDVVIEAVVLDDGSMLVEEKRTVSFRGSYSGMFHQFDLSSGIKIVDIEVLEAGVPYVQQAGPDPGPPGTFFVTGNDRELVVDWSYDAVDEVRTFTIRYRVVDAVVVHADTAELYYQFIGSGWPLGSDNVLITVELPQPAAVDEVKVWGHGPAHGKVEIGDDGIVRWYVTDLPAHGFVEGRVTFSPDMVPGASVRTQREALPNIIAEEDRWARDTDRQRQLAVLEVLSSGLVVMGAIAAAVWVWFRHGKELTPAFDGDYFRELPGEYSPAELGVLWRFGSVAPDDLVATIVDLARRGVLRIEEIEVKRVLRKSRTDYRVEITGDTGRQELARHEQSVLTLLNRIGGGGPVTFDQIKAYARRYQQAFSRFWREWSHDVANKAAEHRFFDERTKQVRIVECVSGVFLFMGGAFLAVSGVPVLGIGMSVGAVVLVIAGALLRRRSQTGVDDFTRWRAFRRFLLHFSDMKRHELPSLVIWEHYLVYAITLGVASQVLKQLQLAYPDLQQNGRRFGQGWFMYRAGTMGFAGLPQGLNSLSSTVRQTMRTAASSSSSRGGGGGFSVGGGGGRGGGGGGLR